MGIRAKHPPMRTTTDHRYTKIRQIDGTHPFKEQVPHGYVEYQARSRKNGHVTYFNFPLAKEMGLIPKTHPDELTNELRQALLDTFAIVIINEYDITHNTRIDPSTIKPNRYMATRYLQLQHPDRRGLTSGDGRSLWNGCTQDRQGRTWDITSCGTGATCLSPATAKSGKFFKTGDPKVSYGCGYSSVDEGIIDLLMSEIFTANGIATERVLCVIEFPGNYAIKVRAGLNLLRPSHFFNHLKQGQLQRLKNVADYYIDREIRNQSWGTIPNAMSRYDFLLNHMSDTFARISALFESEYIFCWLDWDGDNILANGGIIDFGSIRQFGLYHHEYRFDDVERWSTNIKEQRLKARLIIQTFAQAIHYIKTGQRLPLAKFRRHASVRQFDQGYEKYKEEFLLRRMGFTASVSQQLLAHRRSRVQAFGKLFQKFEQAKTKRGPVRTADGKTWNVVYSMRDLLRLLPEALSQAKSTIDPREFIEFMKSKYADRHATKVTGHKRRDILLFQKLYRQLMMDAAKLTNQSPEQMWRQIIQRSQLLNRYERITGDAICIVTEKMMRHRKQLSTRDFMRLLHGFIHQQILNPDWRVTDQKLINIKASQISEYLSNAHEIVKELREGL